MASLNTCAPPPSIHLVVARPPELPWQCARHRLHALVLASVSLGTRLVGAACGGGGCAGVSGYTLSKYSDNVVLGSCVLCARPHDV